MPQKLDVASLELFVAVCECKSVTRAAAQQNMTPSAISKRIAKLEEVAGMRLFTRTHAGVEPSDDGVRLLEHARNVLYHLESIEREIHGKAGTQPASVRVLANRSANAHLVPSTIASFLAGGTARNVDVQIGEATSHEVIARVRDGSVTVGVCWPETDMAGIDWNLSGRDELAVITPADHPLAQRPNVAFAETLAFDQVGIYTSGPVTHLMRRESVRAGKILKYRVVAPTLDAMMRFVEARIGIAIMPAAAARRYVMHDGIAIVALTDSWRKRQFVVCARNRRSLSRAASELYDCLSEAAGAQ